MGKYRKPSFFVSRIVNPLLMALGSVPVLGTRGRSSGEWRRVPVNVLELEGRRYLVAPRGNTHWARNLLAHPEAELKQVHALFDERDRMFSRFRADSELNHTATRHARSSGCWQDLQSCLQRPS